MLVVGAREFYITPSEIQSRCCELETLDHTYQLAFRQSEDVNQQTRENNYEDQGYCFSYPCLGSCGETRQK